MIKFKNFEVHWSMILVYRTIHRVEYFSLSIIVHEYHVHLLELNLSITHKKIDKNSDEDLEDEILKIDVYLGGGYF